MTSLETVIWKPDFISKPSIFPPWPMVMLRSACAQKSMTHFICTRAGSMLSRRMLVAANLASS